MINNQINDNDKDFGKPSDVNTITKEEIKVKRPNLFKVILLNDDYTPMESQIDIYIVFNVIFCYI